MAGIDRAWVLLVGTIEIFTISRKLSEEEPYLGREVAGPVLPCLRCVTSFAKPDCLLLTRTLADLHCRLMCGPNGCYRGNHQICKFS